MTSAQIQEKTILGMGFQDYSINILLDLHKQMVECCKQLCSYNFTNLIHIIGTPMVPCL